MPAARVATLSDMLNDLFEAEISGIFATLGRGNPHIARAFAELHKPIENMIHAAARRANVLADLIDQRGGTPPPPGATMAEQDLAFLSLKFLLPKLIEEKRQLIARYGQAVNVSDNQDSLHDVFEKFRVEHEADLKLLQSATEDFV